MARNPMRSLTAVMPLIYHVNTYIAYAVGYAMLGRFPEGNRSGVMTIAGGTFFYIGLVLLLWSVIGLASAVRWGLKDRQWGYLIVLVLCWSAHIALLMWDPLHAWAWFMY